MAAIIPSIASRISNIFLLSEIPPSFSEKLSEPMYLFLFVFSFSLSLLFFFFCFYVRAKQRKGLERTQSDPSLLKRTLAEFVDKTHQARGKDPTPLTHSLLLEILPPDSSEWGGLLCGEKGDDDAPVGSGQEEGGDQRAKKKKRRTKKKRLKLKDEENGEKKCVAAEKEDPGRISGYGAKPELVCLYPFTSTSSTTQRKIKQQYDQLVKCHETKGLTLAQVGEFANCLIEARNELQQKSEVIKRKFTITKALLFKADRSSFDRLRQQIYKLEMEQKRLEEDAFVYNWLQQQLKLSPAYKKMLEISLRTELKAKSSELMECEDNEYSEISFEELLAQEKKDSFWQKNGKSRLSSS